MAAKASRIGLIAPGQQAYGRLLKFFRQSPAFARDAVARGMYEAMQDMMVDAKNRAPKDTWRMADSGYVARPRITPNQILVESGFGGPSEKYVVRQHEDTGLNHPNGGEAKFFENALNNAQGAMKATIRAYVLDYFRSKRVPSWPAKIVPETPWEASGMSP